MIKIFLISGGAPNGKGIFPAYFIKDGHFLFYTGRTFGKNDDAVRQSDRFGEIVGDEKGGFSGFTDNGRDVSRDEEAGLKIQSAEGFVEKEKIGADCHGADQRHALPHTAGKLGGFFIPEAVKAVIVQKLQDIFDVFLRETVGELQTENQILVDGSPFKEMVSLQHIADFQGGIRTVVFGGEAPIEDFAVLRGKQACDKGKKRGFSDGTYLETFEYMLIIKTRIRSIRYFESMSLEFDMTKISDRINYELFDRRIPKARLAREIGVSRDLVGNYTRASFSEESMQISVLKSFAAYFGKDTYYFCNDYHRFIDTVDVVKLLKRLRQEKGMTQRMFAEELNVTLAMYKAYEVGKCRLTYLVYLRLRELYGVYVDQLIE